MVAIRTSSTHGRQPPRRGREGLQAAGPKAETQRPGSLAECGAGALGTKCDLGLLQEVVREEEKGEEGLGKIWTTALRTGFSKFVPWSTESSCGN